MYEYEIIWLGAGIIIGYFIGSLFVWNMVRKRAKKLNIWNELNKVR